MVVKNDVIFGKKPSPVIIWKPPPPKPMTSFVNDPLLNCTIILSHVATSLDIRCIPLHTYHRRTRANSGIQRISRPPGAVPLLGPGGDTLARVSG